MTIATARPAGTLTRDEAFVELARCEANPRYFIETYCKIRGEDGMPQPFRMWPHQVELLALLLKDPHVALLKARQLGITTEIAGIGLWGALFKAWNILIVSQGQRESSEFADKLGYMYDRLPDWLQLSLRNRNTTEMTFGQYGNKILALPSSEDAGSSFTAQLVVIDEAAKHPAIDANYAALKPTVSAGNRMWVLSSAKGRANWFAQHYTAAKNGVNGFRSVFLPWNARPDRDQAWYAHELKSYLGKPNGEALFHQENPRDDVEAFMVSGNPVFNVEAMRAMLDGCRAPLAALSPELASIAARTGGTGTLHVWKLPAVGVPYVAFSDYAEAKPGGDMMGTGVMDARSCEKVAALHGQWPEARFTEMSAALAKAYNTALWGIERAGNGYAGLHIASEELKYPRLFQDNDKRDGWVTGPKSRPVMVAALAESIATRGYVTYDKDEVDEMMSFVRKDNNREEADSGAHDDRVMVAAGLLQMRSVPGAMQGQFAGAYSSGSMDWG